MKNEKYKSTDQFSTLNSQLSIRENALFVADAHYPHHGEEFLLLLKALEEGRIEAPQLFLMGDIFDLIFGCGEYILSHQREAVETLRRLSERMEIHYLEGNHDFLLKNIFPNINVYPRGAQPVLMELEGEKVMLSHGDRYETGWGYEIFSRLLRCRGLLCLLLPWQKRVVEANLRPLRGKSICKELKDFDQKVQKILAHYPEDARWVVEGHFHQGRIVGERYVALPSLACQKAVARVEEGSWVFYPFDPERGELGAPLKEEKPHKER